MSDIDFDSEARRRSRVLQATKDYFGNDRVLNICTYGTEGSKSAIITACRALGYEPDVGIYLSSLIKITRGNAASLKECFYGDADKGITPNTEFVNKVSQYPKLKEIAMGIESQINKRGIHASAVVIFNDEYWRTTPMMRAPNGQRISQYDMHVVERLGGTKMDYLTTECLDQIRITLDLLIEEGYIEPQATLRDTYRKYIHPDVLDTTSEDMWLLMDHGKVQSLFEYNTELSEVVAQKLHARSVYDVANGNSLMRLVAPEGEEPYVDKFIRFKSDSSLWQQLMDQYCLTQSEQEILRKHYSYCYGVTSCQEDYKILK